jgi:hypothetical protein
MSPAIGMDDLCRKVAVLGRSIKVGKPHRSAHSVVEPAGFGPPLK